MTASPTAAQLPGVAPAPAPAEAPPDILEPGPPDATQPPPERRRKVAILLLLLLGLTILLAIVIWYLLFRQPIPLPGIPETQIPTYRSAIYGVDRPMGIAVSPSGDRIYVSETEGERIVRIFAADGAALGTLRPPVETGSNHVPVYVAIDPITSEVYVSDRPTGSVYVYDRDGAYLREYRPAAAGNGWQPLAMAFDAEGTLYVSNLAGPFQRVLVIDRAGNLVRTLGAGQQLAFPNGVAVDASGNVYVTDSNNGRLLVYGPDGSVVGQIGRGVGEGNLGLPRGLAIDERGRVFTVDTSGQGLFVYRVLAEGQQRPEFLGFFGGHGLENGLFRYPNDVAVDSRGRVFVTDSANDRVQVWSY